MISEENTWEPISLEELRKLIESDLPKMSSKQVELWNKISITPEKWQDDNYGELGGGFWVVAVWDNQAIWYNDIEEGFNISSFSIIGKLNEYGAEQDELQWAIRKLSDSFIIK